MMDSSSDDDDEFDLVGNISIGRSRPIVPLYKDEDVSGSQKGEDEKCEGSGNVQSKGSSGEYVSQSQRSERSERSEESGNEFRLNLERVRESGRRDAMSHVYIPRVSMEVRRRRNRSDDYNQEEDINEELNNVKSNEVKTVKLGGILYRNRPGGLEEMDEEEGIVDVGGEENDDVKIVCMYGSKDSEKFDVVVGETAPLREYLINKVSEKMSVPKNSVVLRVDGDEVGVNDTVESLDMEDGCVVDVSCQKRIEVTVQKPDSTTITARMYPHQKVSFLLEKLRVENEIIRLFYMGQELSPNDTFGEKNVKDRGVLQVMYAMAPETKKKRRRKR